MEGRLTQRLTPVALAALLIAATPATPAPTAAPALSPNEIVAAAPASDWIDIAPADLLVMDLAADPGSSTGAGGDGHARRVVIQLMPPPFSQGWVGNIRKLAAAHWWDGTSINRVQDNYVVQWGDPDGEDKAKAKALPLGLAQVSQSAYAMEATPELKAAILTYMNKRLSIIAHLTKLTREAIVLPNSFANRDAYTGETIDWKGWPIGTEPFAPSSADGSRKVWPIHCYAMVGVGRDMPPDTGTGAELYTVIGTPPRHLDRNIALVGRVIAGIEHLSSLPRGTGALGFYERPEQRVPITSVRIGTEVAGLPRYQFLSTESASFARYADARANRRDAFFIQPAGGVDICNVPVPIRVRP